MKRTMSCRFWKLGALLLVVSLLLPMAVFADDVVNVINTDQYPGAVITMEVGDTVGVGFQVIPTNGTPEVPDAQGCNVTGSKPRASLYVTLPETGFVSASATAEDPMEVVGCDDVHTIYFTALKPGRHTFTGTDFTMSGGKDGSNYQYPEDSFPFTLVVKGSVRYDVFGFYAPVKMGEFNVVKGGSTVPLKFNVWEGDVELTDTAVVKSFTTQEIPCSAEGTDAAVDIASTGGTSLRYDFDGGQFIQNWQTPKQSGNCYQVTMTVDDDYNTALVAFFRLR